MVASYNYPYEDVQDYKGRVTFRARRPNYSTLGQTGFDGVLGAFANDGNPVSDGEAESRRRTLETFRGNVNRTYETGAPSSTPRGSVSLYMPVSIQFNDRINYETAGLGIAGGALYNAIRGGASGMGAVGQALANSVPSMDGISDALTSGLQSEAAQVAALRVAGALGDGITGAVETATGVTLNPNRRLTMKDVPIRTFQFAFKLIPKSRREAIEVENIINFLRREMYPESKSAGGVPVAFKFPSIFDIALTYDGKQVGTKILPSYLESVNTVYNATGMSFHEDGRPQEIDLNLTFREERALNKDDIEGLSELGSEA